MSGCLVFWRCPPQHIVMLDILKRFRALPSRPANQRLRDMCGELLQQQECEAYIVPAGESRDGRTIFRRRGESLFRAKVER